MDYGKLWALYDKPGKLGRSERIKTLVGCLRGMEGSQAIQKDVIS